jgi:hypothetical protein
MFKSYCQSEEWPIMLLKGLTAILYVLFIAIT